MVKTVEVTRHATAGATPEELSAALSSAIVKNPELDDATKMQMMKRAADGFRTNTRIVINEQGVEVDLRPDGRGGFIGVAGRKSLHDHSAMERALRAIEAKRSTASVSPYGIFESSRMQEAANAMVKAGYSDEKITAAVNTAFAEVAGLGDDAFRDFLEQLHTSPEVDALDRLVPPVADISQDIRDMLGVPAAVTAPLRPTIFNAVDKELQTRLSGHDSFLTSPNDRIMTAREVISRDARFASAKGITLGKPRADKRPGIVTTGDPTRNEDAARDLLETILPPFVMSKPQTSVFHHLQQAFHKMEVLVPTLDDPIPLDYSSAFDVDHTVIVCEHNWAAALANARDADGGDLRLPAEYCAIEFRINNRRVVACLAQNLRAGVSTIMLIFIELRPGWAMCGSAELDERGVFTAQRAGPRIKGAMAPLMEFLWSQIRAMLIVLDAGVAVTEMVRPSPALVKSRQKNGRVPPATYHVVKLTRRTGPRAEPQGGTHASPRLHFRRGHWRHHDLAEDVVCTHDWSREREDKQGRSYCRHCEAWRQWIKWQLVGDPDTQFIDKHYRI